MCRSFEAYKNTAIRNFKWWIWPNDAEHSISLPDYIGRNPLQVSMIDSLFLDEQEHWTYAEMQIIKLAIAFKKK